MLLRNRWGFEPLSLHGNGNILLVFLLLKNLEYILSMLFKPAPIKNRRHIHCLLPGMHILLFQACRYFRLQFPKLFQLLLNKHFILRYFLRKIAINFLEYTFLLNIYCSLWSLSIIDLLNCLLLSHPIFP